MATIPHRAPFCISPPRLLSLPRWGQWERGKLGGEIRAAKQSASKTGHVVDEEPMIFDILICCGDKRHHHGRIISPLLPVEMHAIDGQEVDALLGSGLPGIACDAGFAREEGLEVEIVGGRAWGL